jgi:hypothetical protein
LAPSNISVLLVGANSYQTHEFVFGQNSVSGDFEFWIRFADWLQPVWPGRLDVFGNWNGWLRANWTPPDDIFRGGNIRQLAASPMGEAVGILLRPFLEMPFTRSR